MTRRVKLPVRGTSEGEMAGWREVRDRAPSSAGEPEATVTPSRDPALSPSADAAAPDMARLWRALRDVMDPEFPISLVDLGLIYGVRRSGDVVEVDVTFTATACPCMDFIREDIRERLLRESDVAEVRIREVWDPPWSRARITAEGREILRRHGVAA